MSTPRPGGNGTPGESSVNWSEERPRYVSPWALALVYAGLGDADRALGLLEDAVGLRSLQAGIFLKTEPRLDGLRSVPRFTALKTGYTRTPATRPARNASIAAAACAGRSTGISWPQSICTSRALVCVPRFPAAEIPARGSGRVRRPAPAFSLPLCHGVREIVAAEHPKGFPFGMV